MSNGSNRFESMNEDVRVTPVEEGEEDQKVESKSSSDPWLKEMAEWTAFWRVLFNKSIANDDSICGNCDVAYLSM